MNGVKTRTGKIGQAVKARLERAVKNPHIVRAGWCALRLAVGFILPGAELFGSPAPFGVAFAAAYGFGLDGGFALLGVLLGYFRLASAGGIRCVAATVLTFSAGFCLKGTEAAKKRFFLPVCAALIYAMMNVTTAVSASWRASAVTVWLLGAALAGACVYFFGFVTEARGETEEGGRIRTISLLVFLTTLFMALSGVTLVANISAGRLCASLAVLYAARREGLGKGAAVGLSVGLAMDMARGGTPFFAVVYALSGLISGMFCSQRRLLFTIAFVLADAAASLWAEGSAMRLSLLYETFVASVVFLMLPEAEEVQRDTRSLPLPRIRELVTREAIRTRLENAARAFREMYTAMSAAFPDRGTANDGDAASVFSRTADRLCRKCELARVCWAKEMETTKNAVGEATPKMIRTGRLEAGDLPKYFSSRCIHMPEFIDVANQEIRGLLERRQRKARLREDGKLLCRQFSELSQILSGAAEELGGEYGFLPDKEAEVYTILKKRAVEAEAAVYRGGRGRLFVEIGGKELPSEAFDGELQAELEKAVGAALCAPEEQKSEDGHRFRYMERELFRVLAGASARRKDGQEVSGDSATYFRTEEGELFVILADGMGSGREAADESRLTVSVMERFLRAGVSPEVALRTANSAFLLKNREDGVFSTLDLIKINLFTGVASIYKYGAAPSYIKRDKQVSRVGCASLPLGMSAGKPLPDMNRVKLRHGDYVVVASDGLSDKDKDKWLVDEISGFTGSSPVALADALMRESSRNTSQADDVTVYAFRLEAVV